MPIGRCEDFREPEDDGLGASEFAVLLRFATDGRRVGALEVPGMDGLPGTGGAAPPGGFGADRGSVSESERYEASRLAGKSQTHI